MRVERRVVPVTGDPDRRLQVFERELWRIAVEHLSPDEQHAWAALDEAGKAFMGVALLYDDPAITPRALQKAAAAYQKAGRKEEADRVTKQLHDRYPDFAGG